MSPPAGRPGPRARAKRAESGEHPPTQAPARHRWQVAVDFDGVLHAYTSGWEGEDVIADEPVDGAIAWLEHITRHFDVAIYSTRCRTLAGRVACSAWLREHGLSHEALMSVYFATAKPTALIYLDDRAVRFDGQHFPEVDEIWQLKPWARGRG